MEHHYFSKGCSSKQDTIAVFAVALQEHIIHSHQLKDLTLADPLKSRTRNRKNIYKPVNKEMVRAVVDTRLRKKSTRHKTREDAGKEYVLDPSLPQLTLAEQLGLVEPPSLPLSAEEWVRIKQRSIQHGDSLQPCAIRGEEFAFSLRIQASWKGFIVRKWYKNLRKTVPPKDSKLRKQFFEKKVQQISKRLLSLYNINLDEFFLEVDSSIATTQDVLQQSEGKAILVSEADWEKIHMQALQQEILDCPICIMPLSPAVPPACLSSSYSSQFSLETVLLSCSHLFPHTCLQALEEFSLGERHLSFMLLIKRKPSTVDTYSSE